MYNHNKIEKKWQENWQQNNVYAFKDIQTKPKFYVLDMFPYPSGKGLHVGHPKGYTATDIISRYKKLKGFNVLHPIGWDAFGLPAEQYALDTNNDPRSFTYENINHFREQLKALGFDYDYNKEVNTTDPKYYRWTQWIFIKLYEHGLAELKDVDVNWCEGLSTVLANEEVVLDKNGNRVSERGGYPVIRKPMKQWVLKITKYADELLEGLNEVDWPESLKILQRNWIGKMQGVNLDFQIKDQVNKITVFTTRIDTIYGVSFLVLSPKHPLVYQYINKIEGLKEYIDTYNKKSDREIAKNTVKTGIKLPIEVIHPLTHEVLPVYVSDYVLAGVGTDSIMGVPCHNENDYWFAKTFNLKLIQVLDGKQTDLPFDDDNLHINSFDLNGLNKEAAINKIMEILAPLNIAHQTTYYKLKDWLFSRQRYWGEPFPVYYDENNNIYLDKQLPLKLPETNDFKPNNDGKGPLANITDWVYFIKDDKKYHRDTNTMPQWAGSCWYYLGYLLKNADGSYTDLDSNEAKERFLKWLPVDVYIGGQEHAVLHLLYARFWHRFLYNIGIVPTKEPFMKIINQGMILGENGEKMSKSKGNVINPDTIIASHGADALRLYEMFMGPLTASLQWSDESLNGMRKWLDRIYRLYSEYKELGFKLFEKQISAPNELLVAYNQFLKDFSNAIEEQQFNMAISYMMIFINEVYKIKIFNLELMKNFLICLSVYAPHLSEELFSQFKCGYVSHQNFPEYNEEILNKKNIVIPIMVDGKLRDTINAQLDIELDDLEQIAFASEKIKNFLQGKEVIKVIAVKNKIVNIITKNKLD